MRLRRRLSIAFLLFAVSCFAIPSKAYAAPIDIFDGYNEVMGYLTTDNLSEHPELINSDVNTYWRYVQTYTDLSTISGTSTESGNESAHTVTSSVSIPQHTVTSSVSIPSYQITTASVTGTYEPPYYSSYTGYGYDEGGVYFWEPVKHNATNQHASTYSYTIPKLTFTSAAHAETGTYTYAAVNETGTYNVPKVTISSSGTFAAQDTTVGTLDSSMMRLDVSNWSSSGDVYAVMSFASEHANTFPLVSKGEVIRPMIGGKPIRFDNLYFNRWASTYKLYTLNGSQLVELTSANGYIVAPFNMRYLIVVIRLNLGTVGSGSHYLYVSKPKMYLYSDYAITQQTASIQTGIETQTDELKDTTGSNTIVSDIVGQGDVLAQKLGFVYQTTAIARNIFDAFNYEGENSITFPQLAWQGTVIIPETQVPILGWLPTEIETRVKDAMTLVLFLAWLHGMHSLYARIFLGQIETISEDD